MSRIISAMLDSAQPLTFVPLPVADRVIK
jgi:hypothetical protein